MSREPELVPNAWVDQGFGLDPDASWEVDARVDRPAQIAAAYLQHRLLLRLREQGPGLKGKDLAEVIGKSEPTASRVITGGRVLGLDDLVALAFAGGVDLRSLLDDRLERLLPSGVPQIRPNWHEGDWKPAEFVDEGDVGGLPWKMVVDSIAAWVETESGAQRLHLLSSHVLSYRLVAELADRGVEGGVVDRIALWDGDDSSFVVNAATRLVVSVTQQPGLARNTDDNQRLLGGLLRALYDLAGAEADGRVALVVAETGWLVRLDTQVPGIKGKRSLPVDLTAAFADVGKVADVPAVDLRVRLLARKHAGSHVVMALSPAK